MKMFNGRKKSHGQHGERSTAKCPICGNSLVRFLGEVRCTEIRTGKGARSGSAARRIVKHGSLRTIAKRLRQQQEARQC